jgi:hypothetical protein
MFYAGDPDQALRLGDVVEGFILGAANVDRPRPGPMSYQISVTRPERAAVLTPCCSVGEKTLCLAPLVRIRSSFFTNPYLAEDLTRINRPMLLQQSVPPAVWDSWPPDEQSKRLADWPGMRLAFTELFTYQPHDLLAPYELGTGGCLTGYYMIDFRQMHRVESKSVVNTRDVPLHARLLQLSVEVRSELRDKLSYYFGRIPVEDQI